MKSNKILQNIIDIFIFLLLMIFGISCVLFLALPIILAIKISCVFIILLPFTVAMFSWFMDELS